MIKPKKMLSLYLKINLIEKMTKKIANKFSNQQKQEKSLGFILSVLVTCFLFFSSLSLAIPNDKQVPKSFREALRAVPLFFTLNSGASYPAIIPVPGRRLDTERFLYPAPLASPPIFEDLPILQETFLNIPQQYNDNASGYPEGNEEINLCYLYEDQDINELFRLRALEVRLDLDTNILMPPLDDNTSLLAGQLEEERDRYLARLSNGDAPHPRNILLPLNLPRLNHWIGVFIRLNGNNHIIQAQYIDSLGHSCQQSMEFRASMATSLQRLSAALREVYGGNVVIENLPGLIQSDGAGCGPLTIENLVLAASERLSDWRIIGQEEMREIRAHHIALADVHEPNSDLRARQRGNRDNICSFNSITTAGLVPVMCGGGKNKKNNGKAPIDLDRSSEGPISSEPSVSNIDVVNQEKKGAQNHHFKTNMFSSLVFHIKNDAEEKPIEVEFSAAELIRIAWEALEEVWGTDEIKKLEKEVKTIDELDQKKLEENIKKNSNILKNPNKTDKHDEAKKALFLPYNTHEVEKNNINWWLSIAKYFNKKYVKEEGKKTEKTELAGWWFNVGGRVVRLRNDVENQTVAKGRKQFYVADHGAVCDIVKNTSDKITECLSLFTWIDYGTSYEAFHCWDNFQALPQNKKEELRKWFIYLYDNIARSEDENIGKQLLLPLCKVYSYPLRDDLLKEKPLPESTIQNNPSGKNVFDNLNMKLDYLTQHEVFRLLGYNHGRYGSKYEGKDTIVKVILEDFTSSIGKGRYEPLIPQSTAYGDRSVGNSYQKFEEAISEYLSSHGPAKEVELAQNMRKILNGTNVTEPNFLPCLTAAWFLSESFRNPLTTMTSLMLLDIIENKVVLPIDDRESENNWYIWKHLLIHPEKGKNVSMVNDMNDKSVIVDGFGGLHPMVHSNSYKQGKNKKDINESSLNIVHQKEGHLIIHWLELAINSNRTGLGKDKGITIQAVEASRKIKTDNSDSSIQDNGEDKESNKINITMPLLKDRISPIEEKPFKSVLSTTDNSDVGTSTNTDAIYDSVSNAISYIVSIEKSFKENECSTDRIKHLNKVYNSVLDALSQVVLTIILNSQNNDAKDKAENAFRVAKYASDKKNQKVFKDKDDGQSNPDEGGSMTVSLNDSRRKHSENIVSFRIKNNDLIDQTKKVVTRLRELEEQNNASFLSIKGNNSTVYIKEIENLGNLNENIKKEAKTLVKDIQMNTQKIKESMQELQTIIFEYSENITPGVKNNKNKISFNKNENPTIEDVGNLAASIDATIAYYAKRNTTYLNEFRGATDETDRNKVVKNHCNSLEEMYKGRVTINRDEIEEKEKECNRVMAVLAKSIENGKNENLDSKFKKYISAADDLKTVKKYYILDERESISPCGVSSDSSRKGQKKNTSNIQNTKKSTRGKVKKRTGNDNIKKDLREAHNSTPDKIEKEKKEIVIEKIIKPLLRDRISSLELATLSNSQPTTSNPNLKVNHDDWNC